MYTGIHVDSDVDVDVDSHIDIDDSCIVIFWNYIVAMDDSRRHPWMKTGNPVIHYRTIPYFYLYLHSNSNSNSILF